MATQTALPPQYHFDTDTQQRYQQALQAGLDPVASLQRAQQYQTQKNIANLGNDASNFQADAAKYGGGSIAGAAHYTFFDPTSNANITKLAPLAIGAALTPFTGGLSLAGAAGLTGLGTAGAEALREAGNHEAASPLNIAEQGVEAGAGTYLGGALLGKAAGTVGNAIEGTGVGDIANKVGGFLNQNVGDVASNLMQKVVGSNPGNKIVDITDALKSLDPKDAQTLLDSGHLPSSLATGDEKSPLALPSGEKQLALPAKAGANGTAPLPGDIQSGAQPRVVWNPATNRAEVIPTGFTMPGTAPLPSNTADVSFGNPPLENPTAAPTPQVLTDPSTGQSVPAPQTAPSSVPSANIPTPVPSSVPTEGIPTLPTNPAEAFTPPAETPVPAANPSSAETPAPNKTFAQKLTDVGTGIRNDVSNVRAGVKVSPFMTEDEAQLAATREKYNIRGSSEAQLNQLPKAFNKADTAVRAELSNSDFTIPKDQFISELKDSIATTPGIENLNADGTPNMSHENEVNKLIQSVTKGKGDTLSAQDVYDIKQQLSALNAKNFGKDLTAQDPMRTDAAFNHVKGVLDNVSPEVRTLNQDQNDLYNLSKGLAKESNKPSKITVVGTDIPLPKGVVEGAKDATGRVIQSTGKGLTNASTPGSISPTTLLATGVNDRNVMNIGNNPQPAPLPTDPNAAMAIANANSSVTPTPATQPANPLSDPKVLQMLELYDIQQTGGKNSALIQTLGNMFNPNNTQLSTTQQAQHDNIDTALTALDAASQNLVIAGGAKGSFEGNLVNLPFGLGQYVNQPGKSYEDSKIETATQIAKAITGSSRVPAAMVQLYLHSLPDVTDTPAAAQSKIDNLTRSILAQANSHGFSDLIQQYGGANTTPQTSTP